MAQIRKFAFNTEFDADGAIVRDNAPKKLTPEEVEVERKRAYDTGTQDALAQAERDVATALRTLSDAANKMLSRLDDESRAMRTEAVQIALIAARKIAGAALDGYGAERCAHAIEAAMDTLRHQPRLVVKLSPQAAEILRPRIESLTEMHAYAGAVLVRETPGLGPGEVSIDWSDGVVHANPADAVRQIEALVEAALASEAANHEEQS